MLSNEDKVEILGEAKANYKKELTRRIVERAFADNSDRIDQYIAEAAAELNGEFKKLMPL